MTHDVIAKLKQQAVTHDGEDTLADYIDQFIIPNNTIYLDGNSLGPSSKAAKKRAEEVVNQQWGQSLIAGWNDHDWIELPQKIGNKLAPIIGAEPYSVVACDSISVNLFKLLGAAFSKQFPRRIILSQIDNFPSDLYMIQGFETLLNQCSEQGNSCEMQSVATSEVEDTIKRLGEQIAVLVLTQVNYKTGYIFDIEKITQLAHKYGILVIWDLAHSAGILPLSLAEHNVDFAVGCTYKYLNGGPGSPAFVYVAPKHLEDINQPLSGWMGHKNAFAFEPDYQKAPIIEQMLCGTPSVISMSVLDAALDVYEHMDMHALRAKSVALNGFFQHCVEQLFAQAEHSQLELACEAEATKRGSQIAFKHPQAYAICQALISEGVIVDFRAPDILRIGFSPLYLSFAGILEAAQCLVNIVTSKRYELAEFQRKHKVT